MGQLTLETVYRHAYGRDVAPYPFQRAVADTPDADILIAPTGLGKTAAVTLGWAWRRLMAPATTPRRLVWCLPMRTLVEQTAREATAWMDNLGEMFAGDRRKPSVHSLMGGAVDDDWRLRPENPAIIVGTQDMLLSRALMRGYGMSRFGWPIDYGLLHSDALWVYESFETPHCRVCRELLGGEVHDRALVVRDHAHLPMREVRDDDRALGAGVPGRGTVGQSR